MIKSARNKTIKCDLQEQFDLFKTCLQLRQRIDNIEDCKNKILYGDSFQILSLLPLKSFDLVVADPPYNLRKTYSETTFKKQAQEEYENYTRQWIESVYPLLKDGASIYVCCDWLSSLSIAKVLAEFFIIRNRITWQREKGRGSKKNWKNSMEDIWFATKDDEYYFNVEAVKLRRAVLAPYKENGQAKDWENTAQGKFRDTHPSNFWQDITIPFWSMPENTSHPTQKPEKLLAKIILASSKENDVILDPFSGSGTTAVTAKKLKRNFVAIEREKEYCIIAAKRLLNAENDIKIQGYVDGVFWERNSLKLQRDSLKKNKKARQ